MVQGIEAQRRRFQWCGVALASLGMAIMLALALRATGAGFFYTLDDPYIHLSLAESLLQGHYGINPGETASPSSSIIYPFVLAACLALGLGVWGPLVINVLAMLYATWLLSGLLFDALAGAEGELSPVTWLLLPLLLLSVNAYSLPLMGMEHSLHVMTSIMVVVGLGRMLREKEPPGGLLLIGILLCPMLRFEGLALSGMAGLAILLHGYFARAFATAGLLVALLAAYVLGMQALGLPPLPSSVLVKSDVSAAAVDANVSSDFGGVLNLLSIILIDPRIQVAMGLCALMLLGLAWKSIRPMWPLAVAVSAATFAHAAVGAWGWMARYEMYIHAMLISGLLLVWAPLWRQQAARRVAPILVLAVVLVLSRNVFPVIGLSPTASHWVYTHHYQNHRFNTEFFPEVVAVNDLGWTSFRNDTYVLDLWGLGSEEARRNIAEFGHEPGWIRELSQEREAVYAAVFDLWFDDGLPPEWCRIAQLDTPAFFGLDQIAFYLIQPDREADMRAALEAFGTTLPEASSLTVFDCDRS